MLQEDKKNEREFLFAFLRSEVIVLRRLVFAKEGVMIELLVVFALLKTIHLKVQTKNATEGLLTFQPRKFAPFCIIQAMMSSLRMEK